MKLRKCTSSGGPYRVAAALGHRAWTAAATALLAAILLPGPAWPWGRIGHRVSARMAEARLTPAALAAVRDLLLPGVSLADASNWADSQREVPDSGPWHYVNVTLSESRYNARFCQPGGCVASRIEDFRQVLLDPRAEKTTKQQALKFLIHFIQDLHQFLHVGDTGSRGGNLLQVRFFDVGSNLHHVWHSQLIEWHNRDEDRWLREVDALATPENSAAWSKGMPEGWATESLEAARAAYCLPGTRAVMESGTALDEAYCQCMLPIVQRQTATAGIRVAAVLNEIFR